MARVHRLAALCVLVALAAGAAQAQAAVEYGSLASMRATPITAMKAPSWRMNGSSAGSAAASKPGTAGGYLIIPPAPPVATANRHALEQNAGKDAAKLMLRSVPTNARVWLNGKFVGVTPQLLLLPPGKYHLEFRGPRMETGAQDVALLPREAREIAAPLKARYPAVVSIR